MTFIGGGIEVPGVVVLIVGVVLEDEFAVLRACINGDHFGAAGSIGLVDVHVLERIQLRGVEPGNIGRHREGGDDEDSQKHHRKYNEGLQRRGR